MKAEDQAKKAIATTLAVLQAEIDFFIDGQDELSRALALVKKHLEQTMNHNG